jgi:hypothetical protein
MAQFSLLNDVEQELILDYFNEWNVADLIDCLINYMPQAELKRIAKDLVGSFDE